MRAHWLDHASVLVVNRASRHTNAASFVARFPACVVEKSIADETDDKASRLSLGCVVPLCSLSSLAHWCLIVRLTSGSPALCRRRCGASSLASLSTNRSTMSRYRRRLRSYRLAARSTSPSSSITHLSFGHNQPLRGAVHHSLSCDSVMISTSAWTRCSGRHNCASFRLGSRFASRGETRYFCWDDEHAVVRFRWHAPIVKR